MQNAWETGEANFNIRLERCVRRNYGSFWRRGDLWSDENSSPWFLNFLAVGTQKHELFKTYHVTALIESLSQLSKIPQSEQLCSRTTVGDGNIAYAMRFNLKPCFELNDIYHNSCPFVWPLHHICQHSSIPPHLNITSQLRRSHPRLARFSRPLFWSEEHLCPLSV